jgi:hypothetical protein
MRRLLVLVLAVLAMLALAACGSGGPSIPTFRTEPTTTSTTTAPTISGISIGSSENKHTVSVVVGQTITLTLDSTYWKINGSSNPKVVRQVGKQVTTPQISGCVPGQGCGTAQAEFIALAPGNAVLSATRTTCGEALRCVGSEGSYRTTVTVKKRS